MGTATSLRNALTGGDTRGAEKGLGLPARVTGPVRLLCAWRNQPPRLSDKRRRSSRPAALTAAALFDMLRPNYAWAVQVPRTIRESSSRRLSVPSPQGTGTINGYLVRPATADRLPGVIVIHENRGLNPYIEDVARRLAIANFIAFAPDGLTSVGGYPGRRRKGARAVQEDRPGQDAGGLPRGGRHG